MCVPSLAEAESIFGWVLEMWGYTIAANRLGIKHYVWQSLQTEPTGRHRVALT